MNGIPLTEEDLDLDHFEEGVLTEIMQQTSRLQKAVFRGDLSDHEDIMDYLMGQPHVMPR
jgi:UDP-glucose:glycoprotein glucosyltransferase